MFLEKKEKLKNNLFIKNEFKNIDRKIILFLVTFFINLVLINNEVVLFVSPFLSFSYLLGFSYLAIVIMASFIASLLFSPLVFFETCLFIIFFLIIILALRFTKLKVEIRLLITSYISDLFSRYLFDLVVQNEFGLTSLFYSLFSFLISIATIKIGLYFLNEEKRQCPYEIALSILVICSFSLLGLDYNLLNISLLFISLSIFYLFISKILDFSIFTSFLFINFLILFFLNKLTNNELLILFIPLLLSLLSNKKIVSLLIYLLSSFIFLIISKESLNSELVIRYSIISLSYLLVPSLLLEHLKNNIQNPFNNIELYEKKYLRKGKEIERELESFSNLFSLVYEEYNKDNNKRLERKKEDVIYHSLCLNCHKNKICYEKDDRLKKLMFKSIESELKEEEINFVNKECFKPSKFFELGNLFKKDYYKEYKYNLEYQGLKEALKSQLQGLNKVLINYKDQLKYDQSLNINYEKDLLKSLLDRNKYDVLYLDYSYDYKKHSFINLCVKVVDHQDVYKIRDLISSELNINLEISEVNEYGVDNFLKIEMKEIQEYQFIYGVHQISLKEEGNGDSYLVYENNNYLIYCLSDGMGVGKEAKEESSFTLKVLRSILETGMDLKNGINLMNSLLKVKNRYETYATLDLVSINKKNLKSHFFKNGAMHSYIYSSYENRLIKINSSSLPIGIVDHVNSFDFSYKLKADDAVIIFSDGLKEDIDTLEIFYKQVKEYNPKIIAREMAMRFKNQEEEDDVSVIVIKITK